MISAPRPTAKPFWMILNVGVKVSKLGVPTTDFELLDIDKTGLIGSTEINLSAVKQRVLMMFTLQDDLGLLFPEDPQEAIGIVHHNVACPTAPSNWTIGMFQREGISMHRRTLAVMNQNPGSGLHYRFALFMVDASGAIVAVCDPRIINN